MGEITVLAKARETTVTAVVTRADGTVEDLGLISYYHRFAPWRWLVNCWIVIKRKRSR